MSPAIDQGNVPAADLPFFIQETKGSLRTRCTALGIPYNTADLKFALYYRILQNGGRPASMVAAGHNPTGPPALPLPRGWPAAGVIVGAGAGGAGVGGAGAGGAAAGGAGAGGAGGAAAVGGGAAPGPVAPAPIINNFFFAFPIPIPIPMPIVIPAPAPAPAPVPAAAPVPADAPIPAAAAAPAPVLLPVVPIRHPPLTYNGLPWALFLPFFDNMSARDACDRMITDHELTLGPNPRVDLVRVEMEALLRPINSRNVETALNWLARQHTRDYDYTFMPLVRQYLHQWPAPGMPLPADPENVLQLFRGFPLAGGVPPLFVAIRLGFTYIVRWMLDPSGDHALQRANPNLVWNGHSALDNAMNLLFQYRDFSILGGLAPETQLDMVYVLLAAGADPTNNRQFGLHTSDRIVSSCCSFLMLYLTLLTCTCHRLSDA